MITYIIVQKRINTKIFRVIHIFFILLLLYQYINYYYNNINNIFTKL
jgi:hypothetical protein